MPSLHIKPPKPSSSSPIQYEQSFTFSAPAPAGVSFAPPSGASSPVAPSYSPITPKVQPILPANISQNGIQPPPPAQANIQPRPPAQPMTQAPPPRPQPPPPHAPQSQQPQQPQQPQGTSPIPPTAYIPPPPSQPFSSEDSTDAIALRAAISALQFQKKKAQADIQTLQDLKKQALDDPEHFRNEVAAKRFHEERPQFGGMQAIIDQSDSDSDEDEAKLEASNEDAMDMNGAAESQDTRSAEVPDSQPSRPHSSESRPGSKARERSPKSQDKRADFSRIPGAQNIVRMPAVNWDKYHITGEPLEKMHEHQRRFPGSSFAYGDDQREFAVAAPYSPFHDVLDGRKDSFATHPASPTGTVSEHPMETRRGGVRNGHH